MLNGIPIHTFTAITVISAKAGLVSHGTGSCTSPDPRSAWLSTPESWSRIHFHTALDTMSGSSHGRSSSARSRPLSGKDRRKNSASTSPITNCPAIDPAVNRNVLSSAVEKIPDESTDA